MNLTKEQREEFERLADPMIRFLCENCHPHTTVIIENSSAVLLEAQVGHVNESFIKD